MKYIKRFDLSESVDLELVDIEAEDQGSVTADIKKIVSQVEIATGEEVISVEGTASDAEINLTLDLSDSAEIDVFYQRNPNPAQVQVEINYQIGGGSWWASSHDKEIKTHRILGAEVEQILKILVNKPDPKYSLSIFEMEEDLGIAQIDLTFPNLKEAEKWIDRLRGLLKIKL